MQILLLFRIQIVDQILGSEGRIETKVRFEVEAIRRRMEMFSRRHFGRHEGLRRTRFCQREERDVGHLARPTGGTPSARKKRIRVHLIDYRFKSADVADIAHGLMEEARGPLLALPMTRENLLHIRHTELLRRFDRVGERLLISRLLAH